MPSYSGASFPETSITESPDSLPCQFTTRLVYWLRMVYVRGGSGSRAALSARAGRMTSGRVARLSADHIPALVARLAGYGAHSLQTRTVLHLLRARINPAPYQLYAAGTEGADLVTVTAMQPTPGRTVLDVCGPESSAGRRQLDVLLRAPELAELWRRPVRVEFIAEGLAAVLVAAAEGHGLRRVLDVNETLRLYARPDGLPDPPESRQPGLEVRSLEERHLAKVERLWWYSRELYQDATAMLQTGQRAGLAVGVFLTERDAAHPDTPLDEPVSWSLVNAYGAESFGFTEPAYRGRGLQNMVLEELIRRSSRLGLPCYGYTNDTNAAQLRNLTLCGLQPEHVVTRLCFVT